MHRTVAGPGPSSSDSALSEPELPQLGGERLGRVVQLDARLAREAPDPQPCQHAGEPGVAVVEAREVDDELGAGLPLDLAGHGTQALAARPVEASAQREG